MTFFREVLQFARSRPKLSAAVAGGVALIAGIALSVVSKPSGQYSGFWSGVRSGEAAGPAFPACPTAKCLDVYVAPWCPHCREATPTILATRDYLKQHGVHTNVIVGLDRLKAMQAYAGVFGPDTLIDQDGALGQGGVPHFYVTDQDGRLLQEEAGYPQGVTDPKEFASLFGLP